VFSKFHFFQNVKVGQEKKDQKGANKKKQNSRHIPYPDWI